MGSNEIEREIVRMDFDGRKFQSGVQGSIDDLDKLKKSFDFKNAQSSLKSLSDVSRTDFSPMVKSLDAINNKLSVVGVAAAVFVQRITNAVIDSAKKLADILIFDSLKGGLKEYETQLNAVQTILANTAKDGTTLEQVNAALDELNTYADKTIYNFTQMTDSIGKFTTAGVDLETSTQAIKGIANVAAVSGANAEQASRAMYQLSQAISSGVVRLQDWISVENAGLGGQVFRDALMDTARVHGVAVDAIVEKNGSFRNSLQDQWLTSDIMLETLSKFTGDLDEAQILALGYTKEQAAAIMRTAEMANDAATKIKTFTQLKETLQEALGSGWAQTWRIILGDFEQAKDLWGGIGEAFGNIIGNSSDARNSMLEMWASWGGRETLIQTFYNLFNSVLNVITALKTGVREVFEPLEALDLFQLTFGLMNFSKALLEMTRSGFGSISKIAQGIAAAFDILRMAALAVLKPLLTWVKDILPAGAGGFVDWLVNIADIVIAFREWAIETDFFDMAVETLITRMGRFIDKIKLAVKAFLELEIVKDITKWLGGLEKADFLAVWTKVVTVFSSVSSIFGNIAKTAKLVVAELKKFDIVQRISGWFNSISWKGIKTGFGDASKSSSGFFDTLKNSELLKKFSTLLKTVFNTDQITKFFGSAREHFSWFTDIIDKITGKMGGLGSATDAVSSKTGGLGEKISKELGKALDFLTEKAKNINYDKLFDRLFQILNTGMLAAIALAIRSLATGGWLTAALEKIGLGQPKEVGKALTSMFGSVEGVLTSFQNNIKADTLQKVAISIALLAGSLILITMVDSVKLLAATGAIAGMVALLFGASGALSKIDTKGSLKATVSIIGMAIAIGILAGALAIVSSIDPGQIEASLLAMAAGIAALVAGLAGMQLGGDKSTIKSIALLGAIALSLGFLTDAVATFGNMKPEVAAQGLASLAASLAILTASSVLMEKVAGKRATVSAAAVIIQIAGAVVVLAGAIERFGNMKQDVLVKGFEAVAAILGGFGAFSRILRPKGLFTAAIGITIISGALMIMAEAVKAFGAINWDELTRGLVGMAGALGIVVIAANLMSSGLAGAAAMLIMSVALIAMAAALNMLGELSWGELAVGLVAIAATLTILGVGALLLIPVIPVLLALGVAMLLMGAAAMSVGAGLLLASIGLVAIGASAAIIAAGIGLVGTAIIELLPKLGEALAEGLVNFLKVIADNLPAINQAMQDIMLGMITGMISMIPQIVEVVFDMMGQLLNAILERLPELIETGWEILKAFLQGIVDNIQEVVEMGIEIVTNIINGIAEALPDLIDAAFNLILTFLDAMAEAIEEYMPKILVAGAKIGAAMISGIVKGLWDGIDILKQAISDLVQEAIDRFKAKWNIASPSKVTRELMHQVMAGWILGIQDKAGEALSAVDKFSEKAQNGIVSLINSIGDGVDSGLEFNPVISPVLDLDQVRSGVKTINKAFDGAQVLARLTTRGVSGEGSTNTESTSAGGTDRVTFTQIINSPKSLDRGGIYRDTKTLTARLATEALR